MSEQIDGAVVDRYYSANKRMSEVVRYWRRPTGRGKPDSGYIIIGDSQATKREDYEYRGFTMLPKYGAVCRGKDDRDAAYRWVPILNHPDGPAEFPYEQVIEMRWYDPDQLPPGVRKDVFFPQLAGVKITPYDCPECEMRTFHKAVHLARHLKNDHEWDRTEVLALGDKWGIDFSKEMAPQGKRVFDYPTEAPQREAPQAPARPQYQVERIAVPTRDEIEADARRVVARTAEPPVKAKRTQTPEQAEKSRQALAKARLAREEKKRLAEMVAGAEEMTARLNAQEMDA